jgi:hypothetical protein
MKLGGCPALFVVFVAFPTAKATQAAFHHQHRQNVQWSLILPYPPGRSRQLLGTRARIIAPFAATKKDDENENGSSPSDNENEDKVVDLSHQLEKGDEEEFRRQQKLSRSTARVGGRRPKGNTDKKASIQPPQKPWWLSGGGVAAVAATAVVALMLLFWFSSGDDNYYYYESSTSVYETRMYNSVDGTMDITRSETKKVQSNSIAPGWIQSVGGQAPRQRQPPAPPQQQQQERLDEERYEEKRQVQLLQELNDDNADNADEMEMDRTMILLPFRGVNFFLDGFE